MKNKKIFISFLLILSFMFNVSFIAYADGGVLSSNGNGGTGGGGGQWTGYDGAPYVRWEIIDKVTEDMCKDKDPATGENALKIYTGINTNDSNPVFLKPGDKVAFIASNNKMNGSPLPLAGQWYRWTRAFKAGDTDGSHRAHKNSKGEITDYGYWDPINDELIEKDKEIQDELENENFIKKYSLQDHFIYYTNNSEYADLIWKDKNKEPKPENKVIVDSRKVCVEIERVNYETKQHEGINEFTGLTTIDTIYNKPHNTQEQLKNLYENNEDEIIDLEYTSVKDEYDFYHEYKFYIATIEKTSIVKVNPKTNEILEVIGDPTYSIINVKENVANYYAQWHQGVGEKEMPKIFKPLDLRTGKEIDNETLNDAIKGTFYEGYLKDADGKSISLDKAFLSKENGEGRDYYNQKINNSRKIDSSFNTYFNTINNRDNKNNYDKDGNILDLPALDTNNKIHFSIEHQNYGLPYIMRDINKNPLNESEWSKAAVGTDYYYMNNNAINLGFYNIEYAGKNVNNTIPTVELTTNVGGKEKSVNNYSDALTLNGLANNQLINFSSIKTGNYQLGGWHKVNLHGTFTEVMSQETIDLYKKIGINVENNYEFSSVMKDRMDPFMSVNYCHAKVIEYGCKYKAQIKIINSAGGDAQIKNGIGTAGDNLLPLNLDYLRDVKIPSGSNQYLDFIKQTEIKSPYKGLYTQQITQPLVYCKFDVKTSGGYDEN